MSYKPSKFNSIWLILVVGMLIRVLAAGYWESRLAEGQQFKFGDSDGYWHLATAIVRGEPYQYGSEYVKIFRTPGYPIFLSILFGIGLKQVIAIRMAGAVLGTVAIFLVWQISKRLFNERTGWIAGWMTCFYPGAIAISILVLAEMLFVPLMLTQLLLLIIGWQSNHRRTFLTCSILSGVCFGLACLTRPSWILFVPFAASLGIAFYKDRLKQLVALSLTVITMCLVMSPWWVRNYSVSGKFVPTSLQTGPSLYDGLNPEADGGSNMQFVPEIQLPFLRQWQRDQKPTNQFEFAFNEHIKQRALTWAADHPGRVAELAFIKFKRIWMPMSNSEEVGSFLLRFGIAAFFSPLLVVSLIGAFRYRKQQLAFIVCVCPAIYFTLLHMIFVGSIRYRQPPMMTLLILGAAVLASWIASKSAQESTPANET